MCMALLLEVMISLLTHQYFFNTAETQPMSKFTKMGWLHVEKQQKLFTRLLAAGGLGGSFTRNGENNATNVNCIYQQTAAQTLSAFFDSISWYPRPSHPQLGIDEGVGMEPSTFCASIRTCG